VEEEGERDVGGDWLGRRVGQGKVEGMRDGVEAGLLLGQVIELSEGKLVGCGEG